MMRRERHSLDWWLERCPRMKKVGGEYKGPCPNCGGTDRFHVRMDGVYWCRVCKDWRAIIDAVDPDGGKPVNRTMTIKPGFRKVW